MDYRMPFKNAIEMPNEILKLNNHSKIIFSTANLDIRKKLFRSEHIVLLTKMFKFEELLSSIIDE